MFHHTTKIGYLTVFDCKAIRSTDYHYPIESCETNEDNSFFDSGISISP